MIRRSTLDYLYEKSTGDVALCLLWFMRLQEEGASEDGWLARMTYEGCIPAKVSTSVLKQVIAEDRLRRGA